MAYMLRISQPLSAIVPELRRAVAEVDASLPVSDLEMLDQFFARQVDAPRDSMVLVGIFGAVALLLAVCGIYAIVAYGVVQRTHEIGIRMALGARRAAVLGLVMRQSTILTAIGLVLGVAVAASLTGYLKSLLFEITPLDATTFFAMPAIFALIAAVALRTSRRAVRRGSIRRPSCGVSSHAFMNTLPTPNSRFPTPNHGETFGSWALGIGRSLISAFTTKFAKTSKTTRATSRKAPRR